MKRRIVSFLTAIVTAAFALSFAAFADNSAVDTAEKTASGIIELEMRADGAENIQSWIDGALTENAGKSSEWYVMILSKRGKYDFSAYSDALLKYIGENKVSSATTRMKIAIALLASGHAGTAADSIAESSVGEQGIMSYIYGLHLLNNGCVCSRYTTGTLTEKLLELQFDDGGWAIMGKNGDIDVTAMTVQALAKQYDTDDKVKAAVDRALAFMSEKQQDDGGYISFGTANPESASQVLIALSSLGIDVTDRRFVKNGNDIIDGIMKYRLDDGSFAHSEGGDSNETATVQACLSLSAYVLFKEKNERMYDFPVSESSGEAAPVLTSAATDAPPAVTETVHTEPAIVPAAEATPQGSYKPIAYIIIAAVSITVCAVLFIMKKRSFSNFAAVVIIGAAAALFINFTDFRSSEDYYSGSAVHKENPIGTITMSIRCDTLVGKLDSPYVPENGIILDTTEFEIENGDTVYDLLTEAAKRFGIQLQVNGDYIAGIAYLYEYDCGDLSGWIYHVNGDTPFVMCSDYKLSDGDVVEWLYTCELGNDL